VLLLSWKKGGEKKRRLMVGEEPADLLAQVKQRKEKKMEMPSCQVAAEVAWL